MGKKYINMTINMALCLGKDLKIACGSGLVSYCEAMEGNLLEIG